ncbi:MAG: hypothetical protein WBH50_20645 [Fuerstiella sp.]
MNTICLRKFSVTSEYSDIQANPPLDSWSSLLTISSLDSSRLTELRTTARSRLVEAAEAFVLRLNSIAEDTELPPNRNSLLTGDAAVQPIVMTGHQPVIFHSGLTFKYEATETFAAENDAIAVAVIIDTDQGDAGQFSHPQVIESDGAPGEADENSSLASRAYPVLAIDTMAESHKLFGHGRLRDADSLQSLSDATQQQLLVASQPDAAKSSIAAFEYFKQLAAAKATALEANTIMRWHHGIGGRMLELPLSAIASFPECLMLTADILKQPIRFASAYNSALQDFREENGIRNIANPFPDLKLDGDSCELPFWVIDHNRSARHVLEVQIDGSVTRLVANGRTVDTFAGNISGETLEPMLLQNLQLVPRGALITTFLRLLFSDLFVHGTGGGRYDRFTDDFIRSWWSAEPPPFTVASASRYLFVKERRNLQRLEKIKLQLRELQYNPQRHFGTGVFSEELEALLVELMKDKQAAVDCMKSFHAEGQSGKDAGLEIQQTTNRIKQAVTEEFEPQLRLLNELSPEQIDAINCRTYPWFFFGK